MLEGSGALVLTLVLPIPGGIVAVRRPFPPVRKGGRGHRVIERSMPLAPLGSLRAGLVSGHITSYENRTCSFASDTSSFSG